MTLIYACAAVAGCRCLTLGSFGLVIDVALIELLRPWLAVGTLLGTAHLILRPVLRLISAPIG